MKFWLSVCLFAVIGVTFSSPPLAAATLCDSLSAGRYDLLYVCPAAWRSEVQRLASHRRSPYFGDYSSIVAPAESVLACYGPGRAGLRDLLAHAITAWTSPPRHVLLVGAFDSAETTMAIIPTWFINDPTIGYWDDALKAVSTDDPYVFAPGSNDSVPVVSLGRIPVWELTGLRNYIDKVIDYDQQGLASWKSRALHLVDDGDFDGNSGFLIRERADSLASYPIARRETYFTRSHLFYSGAPPINMLPAIQAWNAGLGFVLGYGARGDWHRLSYLTNGTNPHGSPIAYDYSTMTFLDSLWGNHSYPVVLSMTCGGGFVRRWPEYTDFTMTVGSCIDQYLLAAPGKGAISISGPSRAIRETAAYEYAREWLLTAFSPDGFQFKEPGSVTMLAKQHALSSLPTYRNEILSIHCLGDPAIQMPVDFTPTVGVHGGPASTPGDLRIRPQTTPAGVLAFFIDVPRQGQYRIELLDIAGRSLLTEVRTFERPQNGVTHVLPSTSLRSGIYFLIVRGNGQIATGRAVLIR